MVRTVGIARAVLLGAWVMLGCGGSSRNTPPQVATTTITAADDDVTESVVQHHRYHHHGGVTLFIAMSLDTLGVSPEQRAVVEKIRTDLHARMDPARAAEQSLVSVLADGVVAQSLDAAKIDAAVAQVTAAVAGVHDASADALNELHEVLTPAQRAALADKVEAHWAVWQSANAEDTSTSLDAHLAKLATDLGLTVDQVDKIRAGLAEGASGVPKLNSEGIAAHVRAFGDAFRNDKFDTRTLTTAGHANAHMVGWGAAHMAHFVETVSPVLTQDQRARFAQRLRAHMIHNPNAQTNP